MSGVYIERRRGVLFAWLPGPLVRWIREPINGSRSDAMKRLMARVADALKDQP